MVTRQGSALFAPETGLWIRAGSDQCPADDRGHHADPRQHGEMLAAQPVEQRREDEADRPPERGGERGRNDPLRAKDRAAHADREAEFAHPGHRDVQHLLDPPVSGHGLDATSRLTKPSGSRRSRASSTYPRLTIIAGSSRKKPPIGRKATEARKRPNAR